MAILEVRGLVRRFGGVPAVDGLDLDVERGSITAVIGPNGAGKTTLLRLIAGLVAPTAVERISLEGVDLAGSPPHRIRRAGIATVLQIPRPFASMTLRENVAVAAIFADARRGTSRSEALRHADELLALLHLDARARAYPSSLTLHQARILELARALAGRPRVLLLDEVMAGLDASELATFTELVRGLRDEQGLTVVWVEHIVSAITALADRVHVLHFGRELSAGEPDTVMQDPRVVEAYLGRPGGPSAHG